MKAIFSALIVLILGAGFFYISFQAMDWVSILKGLPLPQVLFACVVLFFSFIVLGLHYFEWKHTKENWTRFAILCGLLMIFIFSSTLGISFGPIKEILPIDLLLEDSCNQAQALPENASGDLVVCPNYVIPAAAKYLLAAMGILVSVFLSAILFATKIKWVHGTLGTRFSLAFDYFWLFFGTQILFFSFDSEPILIFLNSFFISYILFFLFTNHLIDPEKTTQKQVTKTKESGSSQQPNEQQPTSTTDSSKPL